jgi:hypothetical protein
MRRLAVSLAALCLFPVLLTACSGIKSEAKYPANRGAGSEDIVYHGERESIFGEGGMKLGGSKEKDNAVSITVNAYLWRATLDTMSFMPLASADPFGGTIITEWYEDPSVPGERVKANIFIMGKELRTDGLKVSLFRQVKSGNAWKDAVVDAATIDALENTILTRARQLRVAEKG